MIKKSRFLANVFPVADEQAALAALEGVKAEHPAASHICYAYKCGLETEAIRFHDAGEPQGTAGRPILEVIQREGLRNTLVVVTRYFGGILLGAGGLTRAYAGAAAQAVAAAGKATFVWHSVQKVTLDYAVWGRVERLLRAAGHVFENLDFGAKVSFHCRVPAAKADGWLRMLQDATGGQLTNEQVGEGYYPEAGAP